MTDAPVLASRSFPIGHNDYRVPTILEVRGGLRYFRGNRLPFFWVVAEAHRKGFPQQIRSTGPNAVMIRKYWPQFADLVALHDRYSDGDWLYDVGHIWYELTGALPDYGDAQLHSARNKRPFLITRRGSLGPDYQTTEYREPTPDECLGLFADIVLCPVQTARQLRDELVGMRRRFISWSAIKHGYFIDWIDAQRPRWRAEADACIARHSLKVFGDPWSPSPAEPVILPKPVPEQTGKIRRQVRTDFVDD